MSSTGATLSGSYTGASATPASAGFNWGTSSGNLNQTALSSVSGTEGSLSSALSGLDPGTTYYYRAFATVYGTGDYASENDTFYGSVQSFTTKKVATASVTTSAAGSVAQTQATLYGSFEDASGTITETGFYWGTSSGSLTNELYVDSASGSSGNFSKALTGLSTNTTYYYKAYVLEYNEETAQYEYRYGSVLSFKTQEASVSSSRGYLDCYEVPALTNLNGSKTSGYLSDRIDNWYRYYTTNSKQQVATHTYTGSNGKTRTYTVLYDESKYAPLWAAHVMHADAWPDNDVGRASNSAWRSDPAIGLTQQGGLDDANTVGYSRGHLVASNYRQTATEQNKQTFYYSNQAPQWQNNFNDGVWSTMEQKIAANAPSGRDTLYVVTGVLYDESWYAANPSKPTTLPSGSLDVPIPSHFYVCLMKCSFNNSGDMTNAKGIAYLMSNEAHSGNYYANEFVKTIDYVEGLTGFDFFANVPSAFQTPAENTATALWSY